MGRSPFLHAALATIVLLGLAIAVVAALTGLLLVLALVAGLGALNLLYLPRVARLLRIPVNWLAAALLPVALLIGAAAAGQAGAAWGAGWWVAAVGVPRAIGLELARRVRRRIAAAQPYYDVASRPVTRSTGHPAGRPLPPADGPGPGESDL